MNKKGLTLITYGLNESENIKSFFLWAKKFATKITSNYEIIYIDDGSTDNSLTILKKIKNKNRKIKIIFNKKNFGPYYNLKIGIKNAKKKYTIIQMVDLCYNLKNFIKYKNLIINNKVDCLHGFRDKKILHRSDNLKKSLISFINWLLISTLFGFKVKDYQNTYFIKTKILKKINIQAKSSFCNAELILKIHKNKYTVKQVKVPFKKRSNGISKGTKLKNILHSLFEIVKIFINKKKYYL